MIPLTTGELADVVAGRLAGAPADTRIEAVTTDSRTVEEPATLFVARTGEQADGHDHARAAVGAGAVAVLAERDLEGLPCVVVDSTDAALVTWAQWVRQQVDPTVVGVTGSVGKTTTKDFIRAACGASVPTVAAVGSFNNEMGVPLTMLATRPDTEVLVVEMGARGPGQIAELATWATPDIGVVTAVAGVHMELFASLEEVAATKGELVEAIGPDGTAVLNADDKRVVGMASRTRGQVLQCAASGADADLAALDVQLDGHARASFTARTPWGDHPVSLPVAGRHHVGNALFALAVAGAVGLDVGAAAAALGTATISEWRGDVTEVDGVTILDDAYNANPTSMAAALETLAAMEVPGRRLAVLGVMAEIGEDHDVEHRRIGAHAARVLDALVVVGDDVRGLYEGARDAGLSRVVEVADHAAAVDALALEPGDALLVKASRVAGLDRVSAELRTRREEHTQ